LPLALGPGVRFEITSQSFVTAAPVRNECAEVNGECDLDLL